MSQYTNNKKWLLAIFALINITCAYGQPSWSVNASNYTNTMVVAGAININRVESVDTNDVVAAFINGQCRGVTKPFYQQSANRYVAFLIVYNNETTGIINYRLYDASSGDTLNVATKHNFTVNGLVGNALRPYVWASPTLNSLAGINSFSLPSQDGETVFSGKTVSMKLPYGTDLTSQVATFSLSDGATAWVNGVRQTSGTTSNDFTNTVVYTIRSEDEQLFESYSVTGTTIPNGKPVFPDTVFTVAENEEAGFIIGTLAAGDPDSEQSLSFRLVSVSGVFSVSGSGILSLLQSPDYEKQSMYSFQIMAEDNGIPVKSDTAMVVINIRNLVEDELGAVNTFTPNGDGVNEYFSIPGVEIYSGFRLVIFNAMGNIVYETVNYNNDWRGTYNGSNLPAGVYYYSFKGDSKVFTGSITLIR